MISRPDPGTSFNAPKFDDHLPRVSGVDRNQRLYRIVDFFSAAQAIEGGGLYVPLASTFADANEAIDAAMELLSIAAGPCAGIARHFGSEEEFIKYQRSVANRNYVSCWTRTKESVAMWALYSGDESSVQITTTAGHLEQAAIAFAEKQSSPMEAIDLGTGDGQFVDSSKIVLVNYENLGELAQSIDRRRRAYDKLEAAGRIPKEPDLLGRGLRESKRAIQYRFEALEHKDQSFSHEAEVRLIINCAPHNTETLKIAQTDIDEMVNRPETDVSHPEHGRSMLLYGRAILREEAWKRDMRCTPHISLPLHSAFVTEVTIDPRCPVHKHQFMKDYGRTRHCGFSVDLLWPCRPQFRSEGEASPPNRRGRGRLIRMRLTPNELRVRFQLTRQLFNVQPKTSGSHAQHGLKATTSMVFRVFVQSLFIQ